ncbi:hypothetical protein DL764_003477 [Monosporascus ibericus]|uniref:Uncharacterized protein n=1 Tax=Monosporascus ibericus TaxID=155417 RepID=A0A4V1XBE0_9PEZI|nr:hypothetical protein DL764_003477 [Monosporascus ibericus]
MRFLGPARAARHPLPRHIAIGRAVAILLSAFVLFAPNLSGIDLPLVIEGTPSSAGMIFSDVTEHKSQPGPTDIDRVTNDALGFSRVFVVGLPERSDKRDAMALTSALTDFHVEWVDGVNGESWFAEMAYDGSAEGWDLLWLGHCGEVFPELQDENRGKPTDDAGICYMSRKFTISDDPRIPDPDKVTGLIDFKIEFPHTRWVHITGAPICSFAYALSSQGAREVLFDLSVDHPTGPFDSALAGLCRRAVSSHGILYPDEAGDRGLDTRCISVTRPIFFHHKAKGPVNADSDIQTVAGGEIREHGAAEDIV